MNESINQPSVDPEYEDMIKSMTYNDYLSSVISYEDICAKTARYQSETEKAKRELKKLKTPYNELREKIKINRDNFGDILSEETEKSREAWEKTRQRFEFKLSNEKAVAIQEANMEIQREKSKLDDDLKKSRDKIKSLEEELKRVETSHGELLKKQQELGDPSQNTPPPLDPAALDILTRARDKKLLTRFQLEMLDQDVDFVCDTWISNFKEMKKKNHEFTSSAFCKRLVTRDISRRITVKLANISCAILSTALLTVLIVMFCFEPSNASNFVYTAVSTLAVGGFFASLTRFLCDRRYITLPIKPAVLSVAAFIVGSVPGFFAGLNLYAPSRTTAAAAYSIICAAACGLIFRRFLLTAAAKKLLPKITFVRDMAEKELFKEYEKQRDGFYNFMIFCYLNYAHVVNYLSMRKADKERADLSEEISFNRTDFDVYTKELEEEKAKLAELKNRKKAFNDYKENRTQELQEKLEEINGKMPAEPDHDAAARANAKEKLDKLDGEYEELSKRLNDLAQEILPIERSYSEKKKKADKLKAQKKRITAALTGWANSPRPELTNYSVLDTFCYVGRSNVNIIHHDLKPYVFKYYTSNRKENPSEDLRVCIYNYIRGMCRINSKDLMQFNIFDYVSDPEILVSDKLFYRLAPKEGIESSFRTTEKFEMRLISNKPAYRIFGKLLREQCASAKKLLGENADKIPEGEKPSISIANMIKKRNQFLFQICIFIVPREEDGSSFTIPKSILEAMEQGGSGRIGLLPVFFADVESISPQWQPIIEKYSTDDLIFPLN